MKVFRVRSLVVLALLALTLPSSGAVEARDAAGIRLADLGGALHDPFAARSGSKAVVLLFLSVDCPISNRYAPEIQRIRDRFPAVDFRLVYPNRSESPAAIREHVSAYGHRGLVLRDPAHALVQQLKVRVTPEAVVIRSNGDVAYRGRIDDRSVSLAIQRPAASRHDLEDAIVATLAGKTVSPAVTPAVGCYITDFAR